MSKPSIPVGFDYPAAILEIRGLISYEQIAAYCGYESAGSISKILAGSTPPHPQGEALYSLYVALFKRKPPSSQEQRVGVPDFSLGKCAALSTGP